MISVILERSCYDFWYHLKMNFGYRLISDLIPKKSEKVGFFKKWPETKFANFRPTHFFKNGQKKFKNEVLSSLRATINLLSQ